MIIVGTDSKLEVNNNDVTLTETSSEGICFYPVGPEAVLTVKDNTIGEENAGNYQIKVNEKPTSINNKTDYTADEISQANNGATVLLQYMTRFVDSSYSGTDGVDNKYKTIQAAIDRCR